MLKIKKGMNKVLSYLTAFLLISMTALVIWQVFTRYILRNPSTFTEELVRFMLIWTSFLGAAYTFGIRGHMALIFLRNKLVGKKKRALYLFIDLIILIFALILIKGGINLSSNLIQINTPILGVSKGLVYSIVPISGFLITIYQIFNIREDLEMEIN
ncbi:TRAP-type C4-dicarboxylate transport system permease small subunit [Halanaerobium saccharolyticum]|uniref:TRAP-type C4-dicarboxylate transport system permease small subunit n=1 Tax=Halanaerobium saccharolyticum TaxID=43595 RepID=A0A4R7YZG8_9FIRM|nr:TRAP transporter small permease [Halanaerobium saccharolyticum]RAK06949.1 TRAP-type C4-dicarboxylate transport system permease small subunit [Halanaerobium saccharolyticum]TDW01676.1 TRAP-type C4-dicarboxylate transport system permease small subunit [Halanaerobium saccharolyticum]TDX53074.1 TRAP-type C4-dicarboxylate transport system permease small subunit [Halanaerobium saccharolyticum]